jgi:hypothetical protein
LCDFPEAAAFDPADLERAAGVAETRVPAVLAAAFTDFVKEDFFAVFLAAGDFFVDFSFVGISSL